MYSPKNVTREMCVGSNIWSCQTMINGRQENKNNLNILDLMHSTRHGQQFLDNLGYYIALLSYVARTKFPVSWFKITKTVFDNFVSSPNSKLGYKPRCKVRGWWTRKTKETVERRGQMVLGTLEDFVSWGVVSPLTSPSVVYTNETWVLSKE